MGAETANVGDVALSGAEPSSSTGCSPAAPYILNSVAPTGLELAGAPQSRNRPIHVKCGARDRVFMTAISMVLAGSAVNSLGAVIYTLMDNDTSGLGELSGEIWLTYLVTMGNFVACGLLSALKKKNRLAFKRKATRRFLVQLLVPAVMDVAITGSAMAALMFEPAEIVSILKTSLQLLLIALISRVILKKRQPWLNWGLLGISLIGVMVVIVSDKISQSVTEREDEEDFLERFNFTISTSTLIEHADLAESETTNSWLGMILISVAVVLGAVRNLFEEAILAGHPDFPSGALLMVESIFSACCLAFMALPLSFLPASDASLRDVWAIVQLPVFPVVFIMYACACYLKDHGKFWLMKFASALTQKMLALLFPFGTWLLGLLTYYTWGGRNHNPAMGVSWMGAPSWLQLLGFFLILVPTAAFLVIKQRSSGSKQSSSRCRRTVSSATDSTKLFQVQSHSSSSSGAAGGDPASKRGLGSEFMGSV